MHHLPARASNCIACLQVSACTSPYSLGWATFLADRNGYKHVAKTAHSVLSIGMSASWLLKAPACLNAALPHHSVLRLRHEHA